MIRTGSGFDVHAFEEGSGLVLGGIHIPFDRSLKAHSDGDVLVHALCDSLLGAAALGDIGGHFPDHEPRYHNVSSLKLLQKVMSLLADDHWQLANADITIIAEAPRISPHVAAMIECLSEVMGCSPGQLNIKATTTETLGFIGRREGIGCQVSVLIHNDGHH